MYKDSAIDKIRKLLAMHLGGEENEADNALLLAKRIADRHNLELSEIEPVKKACEIIEEVVGSKAKMSIEELEASVIVVSFYNIEIMEVCTFNRIKLVFVGTASNVAIAKYVYEFLLKRFRYEYNSQKKRRFIRSKSSFIKGLSSGLISKLKTLSRTTEEKTSLALTNTRNEVMAYLNNEYGEIPHLERRGGTPDLRDFAMGRVSGENIDIHTAINSNKEAEKEGSCTCHTGNPPCEYCVESTAYCPVCGWDAQKEVI